MVRTYICVITNNFEFIQGYDSRLLRGCKRNQKFYMDATKISVVEYLNIVSVDCGEKHICALSKEGEVYTWGFNYYGQLGLNDHRI